MEDNFTSANEKTNYCPLWFGEEWMSEAKEKGKNLPGRLRARKYEEKPAINPHQATDYWFDKAKRSFTKTRLVKNRSISTSFWEITLFKMCLKMSQTYPSGVSDGQSIPHCDPCSARGPVTFIVFSKCPLIRVIVPTRIWVEKRAE